MGECIHACCGCNVFWQSAHYFGIQRCGLRYEAWIYNGVLCMCFVIGNHGDKGGFRACACRCGHGKKGHGW